MVKISVIIPCYNVEDYIGELLESIFNQTIGIECVEVIAVDDLSTDNTISVIQKYECQYPENVILICPENKACAGGARNIGLAYATGKYIVYADADDYLHPQMLEIMLAVFERTGADYVQSGYKSFDGRLPDIKPVTNIEGNIIELDSVDKTNSFFMEHSQTTAVWRRMYHRDFLNKIQISFPENLRNEDIYYSWMTYLYAKKVFLTTEVLYYYRNNPEGVTYNDNAALFALDQVKLAEMVFERLSRDNIFDIYTDGILFGWGMLAYRVIAQVTKSNLDSDIKNRYIKEVRSISTKWFPNISDSMQLPDEIKRILK